MILYDIFIWPFEKLFSIIFSFAYLASQNYGLALLLLALCVTLIQIPLQKFATKLKNRENEERKLFETYETQLKKYYKGRELHFYLHTLYRQHSYSPLKSMRTLFGLLIQIPLFIGAYRFLSTFDGLKDVSFFVFSNLSEPDQLWQGINILPILMLIINIVSGLIYELHTDKLYTKSELVRVFLIPFLFLLLLYNQSSALLIYWTVNNFFGLCKNIIEKRKEIKNIKDRIAKGKKLAMLLDACSKISKHPSRYSLVFISFCTSCILAIFYVLTQQNNKVANIFFTLMIVLQVLIYSFFTVHFFWDYKASLHKHYVYKIIFVQNIFQWNMIIWLVVLTTFRSYILYSPALLIVLGTGNIILWLSTENRKYYLQSADFRQHKSKWTHSNITTISILVMLYLGLINIAVNIYFSDPTNFHITFFDLLSKTMLLLCIPFFLVWILSAIVPQKTLFNSLLIIGAFILLIYGVLPLKGDMVLKDFFFEFPERLLVSEREHIFEIILLTIVLVIGIYSFYFKGYIYRYRKHILVINSVFALIFVGQGISGYVKADKNYFYKKNKKQELNIVLSQGKNIVIIYLDAFSTNMLDDVLRENPQFREKLDGFTWYKNTVSGGAWTWNGAPGILGGEEYTPYKIMQKQKLEGPGVELYYELYELLRSVENEFIDTLESYDVSVNMFGKKSHALIGDLEKEGVYRNILDMSDPDLNYSSFYFSLKLLDIILLKIFPYIYKDNIYASGRWLLARRLATINEKIDWITKFSLMKKLKDYKLKNTTDTHVTALISLFTHGPFYLTQERNFSSDFFKREGYWSYDGQYITDVFALNEVIKFIEKTKNDGIYDDMQIILVSDHGNPGAEKHLVQDERGLLEEFGERLKWFDSILLVKDTNKHGVLKEDSNTFLGNFDTFPIIMHNIDSSFVDPRQLDTSNREIVHTIQPYFYRNPDIIQILMKGTALDTEKWEVIRNDLK